VGASPARPLRDLLAVEHPGSVPKVSNPMTGQFAPSRSITFDKNMVVPPLNMPNSATVPDRPSRAALTRH